MLREAPAMTVRNNLGELLNEVQYRHDSVLITKGGKPVAALVDVEMFGRIRAMEAEFKRLTDRLGEAYRGVNEADAEAEFKEALAAARSR